MRTKLHFSRFEFKYILPGPQRKELERELQYFVELDPFVARESDHKYFVRSLYLDTPGYHCYYEKTNGQKTRSKFRLRTYTDSEDNGCPRFLEIKGRHNNLVFKHRTLWRDDSEINKEDDWALQDGITQNIIDGVEDGSIKDQFIFELVRKRLRPVMLIDYWRRPYISKYDPEFRITFDDTLYGTATNKLFPGRDGNRRLLLPNYTILEVKFRFHMPKWFHRLIQTMELQRISISKYCRGIEGHELTPEL